MIALHQLPRVWGIANVSPAAMKLETWLKLAGLPYSVARFDLAEAPTGKVPYIKDEAGPRGDSTLIIEYLKRTRGCDPDAWLSPSEAAVGLAFRRMLKEHFYWAMMYDRYVPDDNWERYRDIVGDAIAAGQPADEQRAKAAGFRDYMIGQLRAQGLGRHAAFDVHRLGSADLRALDDFLGEKPHLLGARPATVDATLFAHVANVIWSPMVSPIREVARGCHNLLRHAARMREAYFPELVPQYRW
jgi:glutathione S-transferase